jgi:hypothetical protein
MGSSGGSAAALGPYLQAGSEGLVGASAAGSFDILRDRIKERNKGKNNQSDGKVFYYNGKRI